jgi:DNA-binding transcriptional regulator LsrR (DeoR family)
MTSPVTRRPHKDLTTLRTVARLYYEQGLSLQEIAALTDSSVSTISRMHRQARDLGIVRITVESEPEDLDALAARMRDTFGVAVHVTPGQPGTPEQASRLCGAYAAPFVTGLLPPHAVVAWTGGRTVEALISAVPLSRRDDLAHVPIVGGGDTRHSYLDPNTLINRLVERMGGTTYVLHAPSQLDTAGAAEAFLAESHIAATVEIWRRVTAAVVGITGPPTSSPGYFTAMDHAGAAFRDEMSALGVVGAIVGILYDIDGNVVPHDWTRRTLGMPIDVVRTVPQVIGVLAGRDKAASLVGLTRLGLADTIVTDSITAKAALALVGEA